MFFLQLMKWCKKLEWLFVKKIKKKSLNVLQTQILHKFFCFSVQCPPLIRITMGQHKSDNNNRMIQLTDIFCVLFVYKGATNIWLH